MVAKRYKKKKGNNKKKTDSLQDNQPQTGESLLDGNNNAFANNSENNIDAESTLYSELKTDEKNNFVEDWETELSDDFVSDEVDSKSIVNQTLYQEDVRNNFSAILEHEEDLLEDDFSSEDNQDADKVPISSKENYEYENREELIESFNTIHIVDGEKGGAGKSLFSRTLIEYCNFVGLNMAIIDADTSNQDIARIYQDVDLAFFSDDENLAQKADFIFEKAFEKSVIVNLPSQVYSNVTNWIVSNNLIDLGAENSISFVKWFVCTGGIDSVDFFLQSLKDLGNQMTHVFVKNMGLCDDWSYIENMPEFIAARNDHDFIIMDFPKFPYWERNIIDRYGMTFFESLTNYEIKVVSRQRVKKFLNKAHEALALTNLVK